MPCSHRAAGAAGVRNRNYFQEDGSVPVHEEVDSEGVPEEDTDKPCWAVVRLQLNGRLLLRDKKCWAWMLLLVVVILVHCVGTAAAAGRDDQ